MSASAEIARENGKKGGRPKGVKNAATLSAEQAKQRLIDAYIAKADPINQALLAKAESGDIQAIKELHDRVYGKPNQAVDVKAELEVTHIISIDE